MRLIIQGQQLRAVGRQSHPRQRAVAQGIGPPLAESDRKKVSQYGPQGSPVGNDDDRLALMPRCYLLYSMLGSLVERCPILAAGPGERHIAPVAPAAVHLRVTHRKLVYGQSLYLTEPDLFQTFVGKRRQVQRLTDNLRCPPGTAERAAVERVKGFATSRQVGGLW